MIDKISWITVLPEIALLAMGCVILLVDLSVKTPMRTRTYLMTLATLTGVAVLLAWRATSGVTLYGFGNMLVSDSMGNWLKFFATIAMMVTLVYGRPYAAKRQMLGGGELFTLSLFSLLGMFIMISGNNFLLIYMGLELLTLSSYALVALRRDNTAAIVYVLYLFVFFWLV
jgi:NADH-quinone oxidoreductase subunit N